MNAYECFLQDCKERLIKAAPPECKFGGAYNGRGEYAHILLDPEQRYLLIADEQFRNEDACKPLFGGEVHFHPCSHHVNSSQVFCINVFAPLMVGKQRSQNMKSFLNGIGVALKGDIVYFNEDGTVGTRFEYKPSGKDRTNFDFYVVTSLDEKVYFEIKYTEPEFGRPQKGSRKECEWAFYKQMCDQSRYLSGLSHESFYSNFQINRNIGHITRDGNEFVVFVFPYSNPSLRFPFTEYAKMGRVKVCFSEQLGKIADKAFPDNQVLRLYYHKLVQRYFGF